jgi:hypothetical protein
MEDCDELWRSCLSESIRQSLLFLREDHGTTANKLSNHDLYPDREAPLLLTLKTNQANAIYIRIKLENETYSFGKISTDSSIHKHLIYKNLGACPRGIMPAEQRADCLSRYYMSKPSCCQLIPPAAATPMKPVVTAPTGEQCVNCSIGMQRIVET